MYFTSAIALAVLTFANQVFGAPTYNPAMSGQGAKAIYFMTNAEQNEVVSIPVGSNGLLAGKATFTATGGKGLGGVTAQGPAIPDSLFSQGSVSVVGNLLFAVNPGSNTLSMFKIAAHNPCKLTMVGSPKWTGGEFPMSVTFSAALDTACVANGGAIDGISCFSVSRKSGLCALDAAPRPLGLGQKTPAVGPPNTVSQVRFSDDSTSLVVTVKGDPAVNNTGFIAAYPVVHGAVSQTPIKSSPPGTGLLFGMTFVDDQHIIVADPAVGGAILKFDPNTRLATAAPLIPVKVQKAICWTALSTKIGSAYLTDVAQNHIIEVDSKTGAILSDFTPMNGNAGMTDEVVGGNFLYALSPSVNATNIAVFDISGGQGVIKPVQNFGVKGLVTPGLSMGLQMLA